MTEIDWNSLTVYAEGPQYTLYISDETDQINSFFQSRNDLSGYKALIARKNGTDEAEYVIADKDNKMAYRTRWLYALEDHVNEVMIHDEGSE